MHIVYTSINLDYLNRALSLAKSVKQLSPEVFFVAVICEPSVDLSSGINRSLLIEKTSGLFDQIISLEDFPENYQNEVRSLTVIEMCTSIKARVAMLLLAKDESKFVTYLDPDLYFYSPISAVRVAHKLGSVLITPHLVFPPAENSIIWGDEIFGSIKHGTFNLGFISFANEPSAHAVAQWWADRLAIYSGIDFKHELFTDQKWFNLAPGYFPQIHIMRDPTWNVAPWNLEERISFLDFEDRPDSHSKILFFHFSKYPNSLFWNSIQRVKNWHLLQRYFQQYEIDFKNYSSVMSDLKDQIKIRNLDSEPEKAIEQKKLLKGKLKVIAKVQSKHLELLLLSITKFPKIHELAKKNRTIRKLARGFIVWRNSATVAAPILHSKDSQLFLDKLDMLMVSHPGGGGVGDYVNGRFSRYLSELANVGLLQPLSMTRFKLTLRNGSVEVSLEEAKEYILSSSHVEIHHLYKNELLDIHNLKIRDYSIFLHDKYFVQQRPFQDAIQFADFSSDVNGVTENLNVTLNIKDELWERNNLRLLRKASAIYSPSNYISRAYRKYDNKLKIKVITWENTLSNVVSSKNPINSARPILVIIGTSLPHKGSQVVQEVAFRLAGIDTNVMIYIFGEKTSYTKGFEHNSNVRIFGHVRPERIDYFLASRRDNIIGWIPSITAESYSFALSHFLKAGVPVVATNIGAVRERLSNNLNSIMYDPKISSAALTKLLLEKVESFW